jgi:hypothetical protein
MEVPIGINPGGESEAVAPGAGKEVEKEVIAHCGFATAAMTDRPHAEKDH